MGLWGDSRLWILKIMAIRDFIAGRWNFIEELVCKC